MFISCSLRNVTYYNEYEVIHMNDKNMLTIGELAKLANTTVRTLQYYDKEDLIKPSFYSEGGRRMYERKDLSVIHQILTLKTLGLSLKDIKTRLIKVESGEDIINVLQQQHTIVELQVSQLGKVLESIKMLQSEIVKTKTIDWEKYSQMMSLIKENNEYYWVLNYLDKDILSRITKVHSANENTFPIDWLKDLLIEVIDLNKKGVSPKSEEGQKIAKKWWDSVTVYTKGDHKLLIQLYKFYASSDSWPEEFGVIQNDSKEFLESAIEYFLKSIGINIPQMDNKEKVE